MAAHILDGRRLAREIRDEVGDGAARFSGSCGRPPGLAVLLIGDDPASAVYVGKKEKAAREVGMRSEIVRLSGGATRARVLAEIERLGDDPGIDGLLVQLPLPDHLDPLEIQRAVPASKDVDGFHPVNAGRLLLGQGDGFVPCTPRGVMALVDRTGVDLLGAEAVIVGRSSIVGKPTALLLLERHATVTLCHSRTRDLAAVCRRADVLVAAVGRPGLIEGRHVKPGAVVIDVGVNRITDREQAELLLRGQPKRLARFEKTGSCLVGDVRFADIVEHAGHLTPVPGGVGPLTVAMLLENTLAGAMRTAGLEPAPALNQ